jgi:hypothetical protein
MLYEVFIRFVNAHVSYVGYQKVTVPAGVSSGGIALKIPGRVGHAACFGAGSSSFSIIICLIFPRCWAESTSECTVGVSATGSRKDHEISASLMSSGEGESLIRASYSHECAKAIKLGTVATESLFAGGLQCGFVAIDKTVSRFDALQSRKTLTSKSDIIVGHSTPSLVWGYWDGCTAQPEVCVVWLMSALLNRLQTEVSRAIDGAALTRRIKTSVVTRPFK